MARPPRQLRTPALILKRRDLGEADRLLTLLTPYHGKRDAIAKGARKPNTSKTGHVELYTRAEVLIARGRELDVLVQAELREPFLRLHEDLERGAYAHYAVELLDRFTYEDSDSDQTALFALLDATFSRLCSAADPRLVIRYYELRLLDVVGFRPECFQCVITQEIIIQEDQFFSVSEGGVVSPEGAQHTTQLMPLPALTLKYLRHLQRSPYERVHHLQLSDELHRDLDRVMLAYLRYLLESRLQSVEFIRRIRQRDL